MDQKKIDRLFREKLNSYEAAPSSTAWDKVRNQIDSKRSTPVYYWVAASVTLLIISWIFWPNGNKQDLTPIASSVSHPTIQEGLDWAIQEPERIEEVIATENSEPPVPKVSEPELSERLLAEEQTKPAEKVIPEEIPPIEMESKTAIADVELDEPDLSKVLEAEEAPIKVDLTKIKITYIASSTPKEEEPQEPDSLKGFKKFIAFAGKLSPGEVLADIRDAKDDFISGGFKTKNKDKSSL